MSRLKFSLKLVITIVIIWLVWDRFDFQQLKTVLTNPILLAIIPLSWVFNQLLTSLRLHALLLAVGRSTQVADVFCANMASLFVGNLLPGVIGTDLVKFFYLKKHHPLILNTQLALVLGLDRILGLMAVLFWCSFFSFFIHNDLDGKRSQVTYFLTYLPTAMLFLMLLFFVILHLIFEHVAKFKFPEFISKLFDIYRQFNQGLSKKLIVQVMVYNLLAVFVLLVGLVFVGSKLQLQQSGETIYMLQFFLIPLVLIASMIPITPMGIGVAQITMASAYELYGLDSSVGVSISTLSQLGLMSVSILVGGTIFILGKSNISEFRRFRNVEIKK